MVNTKNHATPVVEKEKCSCGCKDCTCGDKCKCEFHKTFLKCATMLGSAVIIAGAIMMKPCMGPKHDPMKAMHAAKMMMPKPVEQEKAFGEFIMKNPEMLIKSVEAYYQAQQAKAEKEQKGPKAEPRKFNLADLQKADEALVKQIIDDKTNYSLGNKKGKFVIIEFFDYQCGWCKRTNKGLEEAIASSNGKNIRWIPIDTPIFGDASETIARYVLAAGEQGKYAEMHKAVTEAQGKLDEGALIKLGEGLKLNTKKLKADANGEKIKGKLKANDEFRKKLNINGVPMVIVDGRINPGALIGDSLEAVVKLSKDKK